METSMRFPVIAETILLTTVSPLIALANQAGSEQIVVGDHWLVGHVKRKAPDGAQVAVGPGLGSTEATAARRSGHFAGTFPSVVCQCSHVPSIGDCGECVLRDGLCPEHTAWSGFWRRGRQG